MFLKLKSWHILLVYIILFFLLNIYHFVLAGLIVYTIICIGITYSLMDKKSGGKIIYPLSVVCSIGLAFLIFYLTIYFIDYAIQPTIEDPNYSALTNITAEVITDFIFLLFHSILLLPLVTVLMVFVFIAAFITAISYSTVVSPINSNSYFFNLIIAFLSFACYPIGMWYLHPQLNKVARG